MLEREHLDYVGEELKLVTSGLADDATAPEFGKIRSAQYVMTGAATFYYSKEASKSAVPALGIATKADTAYAKLEIRIANVFTGSIVFGAEHIGETTNKNNRAADRHNGMQNPLFWRAVTNAFEESMSEIRAISWLNTAHDAPSQPKPSTPNDNNIKAMTSNNSILDMPRVFIDDFEDKTEDRNAPIDSNYDNDSY